MAIPQSLINSYGHTSKPYTFRSLWRFKVRPPNRERESSFVRRGDVDTRKQRWEAQQSQQIQRVKHSDMISSHVNAIGSSVKEDQEELSLSTLPLFRAKERSRARRWIWERRWRKQWSVGHGVPLIRVSEIDEKNGTENHRTILPSVTYPYINIHFSLEVFCVIFPIIYKYIIKHILQNYLNKNLIFHLLSNIYLKTRNTI